MHKRPVILILKAYRPLILWLSQYMHAHQQYTNDADASILLPFVLAVLCIKAATLFVSKVFVTKKNIANRPLNIQQSH